MTEKEDATNTSKLADEIHERLAEVNVLEHQHPLLLPLV